MEASRNRWPVLLLIILPMILWSVVLRRIHDAPTIFILLKIAIWAIPVLIYVARARDRRLVGYFRLDIAPGWRWLVVSSAFLFLYSLFLNGWRLQVEPVSIFFILSAVIIAPIVEELVFRGFILQEMERISSLGPANVATALLFTVYHFPLWLARGNTISAAGSGWVLFFSLVMGFAFAKSRSLWTCILIHAIQNLIFGLMN